MNGKILIFSAPSGAGKSTVVNHLLQTVPDLAFSVSATTRAPRGEEKHGKDYYFFSKEVFLKKIKNNEFAEFEQVYNDVYYGTLLSEIDRLRASGKHIVLDLDVVGGQRLKKVYGKEALSIFVCPPGLESLEQRLRLRNTDSEASINRRMAKAETEMKSRDNFDFVLINDNLERALADVENAITNFISAT